MDARLSLSIIVMGIAFLVISGAQKTRSRNLSIHPYDVEAPIGKVVTLQCVFDSSADDCYWMHDGSAVNETTLQFTGNKKSGDCSILFDALNTSLGKWQCGLPATINQEEILSQTVIVKTPGLSTVLLKGFVNPGMLNQPSNDQFIEEPSNTTVRSGDNTVLKCIFKMTPGTNAGHCYWEMGDLPIEIADRYSFVGDPNSGDCSLSITGANYKMDNGIWQCGVPTRDVRGTKSKPAHLTVAMAPKEPKIMRDGVEQATGSDMGIEFNIDIDLVCKSELGNPAAKLQWSLNGIELPGTDEKIPQMHLWTRTNNLKQTVTDDWGDKELRCTARHPSYDDGQEHSTYVIVKNLQKTSRAKIIHEGDKNLKKTLKLKANEQVDFYCLADGLPTPEYRWQTRKNDHEDWQKLADNIQNLTVIVGGPTQHLRCIASNNKFVEFAYSANWTIIAFSPANSITGIQLIVIPMVIACIITSLW